MSFGMRLNANVNAKKNVLLGLSTKTQLQTALVLATQKVIFMMTVAVRLLPDSHVLTIKNSLTQILTRFDADASAKTKIKSFVEGSVKIHVPKKINHTTQNANANVMY
jgi:hypothetical protein